MMGFMGVKLSRIPVSITSALIPKSIPFFFFSSRKSRPATMPVGVMWANQLLSNTATRFLGLLLMRPFMFTPAESWKMSQRMVSTGIFPVCSE